MRRRWQDLIAGLYYGFPLCCVLRFALHRGDIHQAVQRGVVEAKGGYVPCGILHKPDRRIPPCKCSVAS